MKSAEPPEAALISAELRARAKKRGDWIAKKLTGFFPGSWANLLLFTVVLVLFRPQRAWTFGLLIVVYFYFASLDRWLAQKARERIAQARAERIGEVIYGWETDKDHPNSETKDDWTRVKLTGQNQILAARVAELLGAIL